MWALFSQHGTVEKVSLITGRDTGRPRGFGFVEMSNVDASRARQALNGTDIDGRALKVDEAQERERSGGGWPRRYRSVGSPVRAWRPEELPAPKRARNIVTWRKSGLVDTAEEIHGSAPAPRQPLWLVMARFATVVRARA